MYFYISQSVDADVSNTKVVSLLKELELAHIDATYMSQADAAAALSKKLPAIVKSFKDYNIDANLPATLYVTVDNEQAHQSLATILPRYADIIENVKDITNSSSVKTQEQRVTRALDFAYFLR